MVDLLKGKKTFLLAVAGAVVFFASAAGYLDAEFANKILGFLGIGAVATLRSAIANK